MDGWMDGWMDGLTMGHNDCFHTAGKEAIENYKKIIINFTTIKKKIMHIFIMPTTCVQGLKQVHSKTGGGVDYTSSIP